MFFSGTDEHNTMKLPVSTNTIDYGTKYLGHNTLYFPEIESTNSFALTVAQNDGPEGTIIIADEQTDGKGRFDRRWYSPKGRGLWFSLILKPEVDPSKIAQLTLVAAVAIAEAVYKLCGLSLKIKWPNDLLLNGKKVCGILAEAHFDNSNACVILGIGINIDMDFSQNEKLDSYATSLKAELNEDIDKTRLLSEILLQLETWYEKWLNEGSGPVLTVWRKKNITLGKEVVVSSFNEKFKGLVLDIDEEGSLIVEDEDGKIHKLNSGEISLGNMH